MHRRLSVFVPLIIAACAVAPAMGIATAAAIDRSDPAPGQVLSTAPQQLSIYAAAALAPSDLNAIDVRAADLREVDLRDAAIDVTDSHRLFVSLQPGLGVGRYVASFVAATAAGTVDRGQFSFYVGTPPTAADRAADARLSLGDDAASQATAQPADPTPSLALAIAIGVAGVISAATAIALRRRAGRAGFD